MYSFNIVSRLKSPIQVPDFRNLMVHGKYTAVRAGQNCQLLKFQCRVMDPRAQATLFGYFWRFGILSGASLNSSRRIWPHL